MSDQNNRVAIVTGGARGIGAAIVSRLAADGMAVAVVDLDEAAAAATAAEITAAGGRAVGIGADVGDAAQVTDAVERVVATLGPPTVLVNNAGVIRDNLLFKMTEDDWDTIMRVHLRGAFLFSRAAQAHMVEAKWGRIVNMSSRSAQGNRGQANYAAAKAGLHGFTMSLARETAGKGITVNSVSPGFIETAMTRAMPDAARERIMAQIPVGRFGQPRDIARAVAFLAADEADYITGANLPVNGGLFMDY